MIFFTFACKESSFFWHSIDHIAHLTIVDVNFNWISCITIEGYCLVAEKELAE